MLRMSIARHRFLISIVPICNTYFFFLSLVILKHKAKCLTFNPKHGRSIYELNIALSTDIFQKIFLIKTLVMLKFSLILCNCIQKKLIMCFAFYFTPVDRDTTPFHCWFIQNEKHEGKKAWICNNFQYRSLKR